MRIVVTVLFLLYLGALVFSTAHAQTPSAAPLIAGCPSPLPAQSWPQSSCAYQWYPLTDTTHAIASVSKSAPSYQHTFGSYASTQLIIACPAGAVVSGASCTSGGKDVSGVIQKALVSAFSIIPPVPTPVPADYLVSVVGALPPYGFLVKGLDSTQAQCFTVTSGAKSVQACIPAASP